MKRREFMKGALGTAAATSLTSTSDASEREAGDDLVKVDRFDRPDSFYHGNSWETLNPGYWKIQNKVLGRRLHNRGDHARHGIPVPLGNPSQKNYARGVRPGTTVWHDLAAGLETRR